jgi:hypothetical protein
MPTFRKSAVRVAAAFVFVAVGSACSGTSTTSSLICRPLCPNGTHCTLEGCIVDEPLADLAVAAPDGGGCSPACTNPSPYCNASGQCVPCLADEHCPVGHLCVASGATTVCVPGCADDSRCSDGKNSALKCCDGRCIDSSSDPLHCGACGNACSGQHASASCLEGSCTSGACDHGWGDCNHDPFDGCEVNLGVDPKSCGACGTVCSFPNALAACSNSCYIGACKFGFGDCNGDSGDGCEKSLLSDPINCGACGNPCPKPPHAAATCVNAACALTRCDVGFADCNANAGDGCEVAVANDPRNCGACGNTCGQGLICTNGGCTCPQCNFPNAKSKCVNNVCVLDGCVQGWGDCNNDPKDGCEKDLSSDRDNCNGCAVACPMGQNCFGGTCMAKFVFQKTQQIDGQTVTCSQVVNNQQYTECDDLQEANMYFPNGIQCGPFWSFQNCAYSDTVGFCQSLTGTARAESYYTCSNTVPRAVWKAHMWSTTMDNGYTQHVRCYY